VDEILLPKCSYNSRIYMNLLNMINKNNLNKTYADTSLVFAEFPQIKLKVLAPYLGYRTENVNNYSIVLKFVFKDFSCILTGDAEKEVEDWLVKTYDTKLDIDFLKVAHHGSRSSNTLEFVRKTSPEYGTISVGEYNKFGLPNMDVLERLQRNGVTVFRTDKDGAMILSTNGKLLNIKTILSEREIVDNSI
ncbi:MAG: DNA internalization-related competence protein ComEC/Rec2, partial [Candidatus Cloacimonetes bacterium]|nr:DNA internalization-related competence protein ComEC/Rec2 [Candidatus Cloacimonadota bacterium]